MSEEFTQPIPSPYGPARQYRSYDIGVLWALWNMCNIIVWRSHPDMPPAAHMAAGVAARYTAPLAQEIGRIAAGIVPTPTSMPLNPSLGASLCEITMPLFFAGVQYQDAAQRAWLVSRIRDIEARTGWASAGAIAAGCETAWIKAAEAGRGPAYERVSAPPWESVEEEVQRFGRVIRTDPSDIGDRRYVHVNPPTRIRWAMGLLSQEGDVRGIGEAKNEGVGDARYRNLIPIGSA